jgi:hypothetical protein
VVWGTGCSLKGGGFGICSSSVSTFPLRACLCQLCACTFLAAHQIALCLVHVVANSACVLQVVGLT